MRMTNELSKTEINLIEETNKKYDISYFGEGDIRYKRNITNKGLLEVHVNDIMVSIPLEVWNDSPEMVELKTKLEISKVEKGSLTTKEPELRIYKDPIKIVKK